jgi:hypothetical protein
MVFSQILKNVLDKNQAVWLPTIGLLGYDKATSKLGLDVYGSGTDTELISLIADIKQVSPGEAKGILIQEVENIKSKLTSDGKYTIDGLGDLILSNGSYQFEVKKTLFPTDFFGTGNFNPSAFKDNEPKVESKVFENTFIKVDPPKKEEPKKEPVLETPLVAPKTEEPVIIEPVKPLEEVQPKDLFEAAQFKSPEVETPKAEEIEAVVQKIEVSPEIEEPAEVIAEPIIEEKQVEEIPEEVQQPEEEDFATRLLNEISQEDSDENLDELEEDILEEDEEDEILEEPVVVEAPKKIIIDEPRRNIGNSRYDEGYYEFDLTQENEKKNNKWPLVAGLALGILALGFMIPWLIASSKGNKFLGLNPLWNSHKDDGKKIEPKLAVKIDSAAIDSLNLIAQALLADSLKNDSLKKLSTPAPTTVAQATPIKAATPAPAAPSKTPSTQPTQTITKNTSTPKTPTSADPVSKKSVAVATEKTKKSDVVTSGKEAASISVPKETTKKEKDTSAKLAKAKVEKVNIIGKPYATANYTKGNHYLSFGKFKIASAAMKLKTDMKKRAGIETDIILLDGTYRVVVPYLSKDKAEAASKDYVSTTLFE